MMSSKLRVVIIKPSKYEVDGRVERFRWGFMPNSTVPYMRSMTPPEVRGMRTEVHAVDEYVHTDVDYLSLLRKESGTTTLLALVGVQSHQFHRALDLAALARENGCLAVIGGPHPMTCDTSMLQGNGVSFALAEAELIWPTILNDAADGELQPVYGKDQRWQAELEAPVVIPPSSRDLKRYVVPMLGLYPARGCPFVCNFCSVIKIAGRQVRSQAVSTTMQSLRAAKAAGVRYIMFTSDNFNKYDKADELLTAMIDEKLGMNFFVQCDTQIAKQEELVRLLGKAGCFQMFLGVESFNRETLIAAKKRQNRPETYKEIVRLCFAHRISSHFSNIIGFPTDTSQSVEEHIQTLRDMNPNWASFYILCPIPGTEQYDEFQGKGWIWEKNLDRFDTTSLTWSHPGFDAPELKALLYKCYSRFYSMSHAMENVYRLHIKTKKALASLANSILTRYAAWQHMHPMAGGLKRGRVDSNVDYFDVRNRVFGIRNAPLPASLALPAADQAANKLVNPTFRAKAERAAV